MPDDQQKPAAPPADTAQDATSAPQEPRMYSGPEVGEIVRKRVERQGESYAKNLKTVAERAAVAAIERVRAAHEAELGALLSDLDMTPADLLAVRRARRAQELRRQPPDQRHPSTWDAADVERMKRDGTFGNAVAAWKGK